MSIALTESLLALPSSLIHMCKLQTREVLRPENLKIQEDLFLVRYIRNQEKPCQKTQKCVLSEDGYPIIQYCLTLSRPDIYVYMSNNTQLDCI